MGQPGNRRPRTARPRPAATATVGKGVSHTDLEALAALDPTAVVVRHRRGRSIFGIVWHAESCRKGRGRLLETDLTRLDTAYSWCSCRPEAFHRDGGAHLEALIELSYHVTGVMSACDNLDRCRPGSAVQRARLHFVARRLDDTVRAARPEALPAVRRWAASITERTDGLDPGDDAELYADVLALLHNEAPARTDRLAWDAWRQARARGEVRKARADRVLSAVDGTKWEPLWNSPQTSPAGSLWRGFLWSFKVDRRVRRWDRELRAAAVAALDGDRFTVLVDNGDEVFRPWRHNQRGPDDSAVFTNARRHFVTGERTAVVPSGAARTLARLLGWSATDEGSEDEAVLAARLVDGGLDPDAAWTTARASLD